MSAEWQLFSKAATHRALHYDSCSYYVLHYGSSFHQLFPHSYFIHVLLYNICSYYCITVYQLFWATFPAQLLHSCSAVWRMQLLLHYSSSFELLFPPSYFILVLLNASWSYYCIIAALLSYFSRPAISPLLWALIAEAITACCNLHIKLLFLRSCNAI